MSQLNDTVSDADLHIAHALYVANLQRFQEICERARKRSLTEGGCTVHVSAHLGIPTNPNGAPLAPVIIGYATSDWYDSSVVRSYTDGRASN